MRYPMLFDSTEEVQIKVFDAKTSQTIEGGESQEIVITNSKNVRLAGVVPSELYWPAILDVSGENFDETCTC